MNKKNNILPVIISIILFTILMGLIIYLSNSKKENELIIPPITKQSLNTNKENKDESTIQIDCIKEEEEEVKEDNVNTSNWKLYTNKKFGYQIRYPESWEVIENDDSTAFKAKDQTYYFEGGPAFNGVIIEVREPEYELTIEEYIEMIRKNHGKIYCLKINNKDGFRVVDYLRYETLIKNNQYSYFINSPNLGSEKYNKYDIHRAMINTLIFN